MKRTEERRKKRQRKPRTKVGVGWLLLCSQLHVPVLLHKQILPHDFTHRIIHSPAPICETIHQAGIQYLTPSHTSQVPIQLYVTSKLCEAIFIDLNLLHMWKWLKVAVVSPVVLGLPPSVYRVLQNHYISPQSSVTSLYGSYSVELQVFRAAVHLHIISYSVEAKPSI